MHQKFDLIEEPTAAHHRGGLPQRFRKGRLLGKGGFAKCYELFDTETGQVFAAKIVSKASVSKPRAHAKLRSEIAIHRSLNQDKVVKFHEYFEDSENVYIILELCPNHTLNEFMRKRPCKRLSESEAQFYVYDLVLALKYLHGRRVIHRDLKLGNLFLDADARLKVGDFGLAAQLAHHDEKKKTICGTPNYIAPEILEGRHGHSYEVDIWSLGVIIYTMLFGRPPFETSDVKATYRRIRYNQYSFPENVNVSSHAKDLISSILRTDPKDRPSLEEIVNSPWFGGRLPPAVPASARVVASMSPRVEGSWQRSETPERDVPDFARIDSPAPHFAQRDCSPGVSTSRRSVVGLQHAQYATPGQGLTDGFSTPGRSQQPGSRPPLAQRSNNENVAPANGSYGGENAKVPSRRPLSGKPANAGAAAPAPLSCRWNPNGAAPLQEQNATPAKQEYGSTACWPQRGNEASPICRPQSATTRIGQPLCEQNGLKDNCASKENLGRPGDDENAATLARGATSVRAAVRGSGAAQTPSGGSARAQPVTAVAATSTSGVTSSRRQAPTSAGRLRTGASPVPSGSTAALGGQGGSASVSGLRSARGITSARSGGATREASPVPSGASGGAVAAQVARSGSRQAVVQPSPLHGSSSSVTRLLGAGSPERTDRAGYSGSLLARTTCAMLRNGASGSQQALAQPVSAASPQPLARPQSREGLTYDVGGERTTPRVTSLHGHISSRSASPPARHREVSARGAATPLAVPATAGAAATTSSTGTLEANAAAVGSDVAAAAPTVDPGALPEMWVTKWVDYSSKYGVGYMLSDGSLGVYFNDSTKIIHYNGRFDYITRRTQDKPEIRSTYTFDDYPEDLKKKVTLLRHFKHYMAADSMDNRDGATMGESAVPAPQEPRPGPQEPGSAIFVRKWTQNKHAILFQLNNKVVQVIFFDKTEAVLSSKSQIVTYVDKAGQSTTYPLSSQFESHSPELAKRLRYAREILVNMLGARTAELH